MQKQRQKLVYNGRGKSTAGGLRQRALVNLALCLYLTALANLLPLHTAFASPPAGRGVVNDTWKITAYCACVKCCGKSDGITASGRKAEYGMVACNWLPFGTRLTIKGMGQFVVADRGAKSLFGSKQNHIKHLDVYMPTHQMARKFGVKYLRVEVKKEEK